MTITTTKWCWKIKRKPLFNEEKIVIRNQKKLSLFGITYVFYFLILFSEKDNLKYGPYRWLSFCFPPLNISPIHNRHFLIGMAPLARHVPSVEGQNRHSSPLPPNLHVVYTYIDTHTYISISSSSHLLCLPIGYVHI